MGVLQLPCVALTVMERKIICGLANGLQSKELATRINRSVPTVEMKIRGLYVKMSARSRAHLVALAICGGVISDAEIAAM